MKIFLFTRYYFEIVSAEPLVFLKKLTQSGIVLHNIVIIDALMARFEVDGGNAQLVKLFAERSNVRIRLIGTKGISRFFQILKKRVALLLGIAIIVVLTIYVPTRIFFVDIVGNSKIEKAYILDRAEQSGIFFGVSRKDVRSEQVKNALLQAIPELKWAGINTYGCRAEIYVLEREIKDTADVSHIQGIYAARDGIISNITVTSGTAQCKIGQAVRAGQILVSGYSDRGLVLRADPAEAEVYGITQRRIEAVLPIDTSNRGGITDNFVNWRLRIGKKQINLHIDSGNCDSECGKIYKTYTLTLPGGFMLPVSIVKETVTAYVHYPAEQSVSSGICDLADSYICSDMIAGKVIHSNTRVVSQNETISLVGVYTCEELIGRIKREEIK